MKFKKRLSNSERGLDWSDITKPRSRYFGILAPIAVAMSMSGCIAKERQLPPTESPQQEKDMEKAPSAFGAGKNEGNALEEKADPCFEMVENYRDRILSTNCLEVTSYRREDEEYGDCSSDIQHSVDNLAEFTAHRVCGGRAREVLEEMATNMPDAAVRAQVLSSMLLSRFSEINEEMYFEILLNSLSHALDSDEGELIWITIMPELLGYSDLCEENECLFDKQTFQKKALPVLKKAAMHKDYEVSLGGALILDKLTIPEAKEAIKDFLKNPDVSEDVKAHFESLTSL